MSYFVTCCGVSATGRRKLRKPVVFFLLYKLVLPPFDSNRCSEHYNKITSFRSYTRGEGFDSISNIYNTIPEMVKQHARNPNQVVHVYIDWKTGERETLTYKNLYDKSKELSYGFGQFGILRGDVVGVGSENSPEWMITTLGLLMSGAIPLYFHFNRTDGNDIEGVLKSAGRDCKAIIFPPGRDGVNITVVERIFRKGIGKGDVISDTLPSIKWAIIMKMHYKTDHYPDLEDILKAETNKVILPSLDPDDIAGIFLTSGSSGVSKLVPHSHRNMLVYGSHAQRCYGLQTETFFNDRLFSWIAGYPSLEFYGGKERILIKNITSIPSMREYHDIVTKILREGKYDTAFCIIPLLQEILSRQTFDCKVHTIITGGQPVPAKLASLIKKICHCFTVFYGSTEAGCVAYRPVFEQEDFSDYEVGHPLPGVEIKVVDQEKRLVEFGEEGEAMVSIPLRFMGYWRDEANTKAVFSKSCWYSMGDSVRMLETGTLIVNGRTSDSLVKIGPRFVSVASIEIKLKKHPAIVDAVVFSYKNESHYHYVCCSIVRKKDSELSKELIDEYLLDSSHRTEINFLQKLELPRSYVFFERFPCTYNGKVDRKTVADISRGILHGSDGENDTFKERQKLS